jgi:uncharacterized membrane protein YgcG
MAVRAADEGWLIERFHSEIEIHPDGSFSAAEALDVDFRGLSKHGIFRDLDYLFDYDATHTRTYRINLVSVTAADGRRHQVKTLDRGSVLRFQIGDPGRTISGKETYRIAYTVGGGLNGFADHDELYWNATGVWPVATLAASVIVRGPAGAIDRVACFQGSAGSTEKCDARFTATQATFTATRPLASGEQMTIVAGLRKGAVADPRPLLSLKAARSGSSASRDVHVSEFFKQSLTLVSAMVAAFLAVVGGVGALWWRVGRDRRYISLHQSGRDLPRDGEGTERIPFFGGRPIAVEFEPPEGIRPGQMGLLLDERADTLDITATIIDLAVRGYLKITELPKEGWFGHKDWQLDRLKAPDGHLLEYERIVLAGIFPSERPRKLSDLKNKFHEHLVTAKAALYADAVTRKWFPRNPESVRTLFIIGGVLLLAAGIGATVLLGNVWGAGLLGLPIIAGGVLLAVVSGLMPRRTAGGQEMTRRTLGFARYIKTAEVHQQAFAERAQIFTEYLPYAIAFKCVDKWAQAFKDLDMQAATQGWYAGTSGFNAAIFSSSLGSFTSSMSTTLASTPGGSGGSGFSGGSSGGGGGGGGGGSW